MVFDFAFLNIRVKNSVVFLSLNFFFPHVLCQNVAITQITNCRGLPNKDYPTFKNTVIYTNEYPLANSGKIWNV